MDRCQGPKRIDFKCIIRHDIKDDPPFDVQQRSDMTVKEFRAWVQARYNIPGLVSLHHSGKKLTDDHAKLGKVLATEDLLFVTYNKNASVATGGVGGGAFAVAKSGGRAFAQGGYAVGGMFDVDGAAWGGNGVGGDGQGDFGFGGEGIGGNATNPKGNAEAGHATAGRFEQRSGKGISTSGTLRPKVKY